MDVKNYYYSYKVYTKVLKYLRMKNNLTQSELSEKLRISPSTVSSHECGRSIPELHNIIKYCKVYNLELYEFYHLLAVSVDTTTKTKVSSDLSKEAALFSLID